MRWAPVLAGPKPKDLAHILAAAQSTLDPVPHDPGSVAQVLAEPGTAGLVVIGDDAALASVVSTMRSVGVDVPIALVPSRTSDLLRLFGLHRTSISCIGFSLARIIESIWAGSPRQLGRLRLYPTLLLSLQASGVMSDHRPEYTFALHRTTTTSSLGRS